MDEINIYRTAKPLIDRRGERMSFLQLEALPSHLEGLVRVTAVTEETIRGYRGKVSRQAHSPEEAEVRRRTVAEVVAKSAAKVTKEN